MYRRSLLAALGTAATAGCLGLVRGPSAPGPAGTPARATTGDGYAIELGTADVEASILTDRVVAYHGTGFLRLPVVLRGRDGTALPVGDRYETLRVGASVRLGDHDHAGLRLDRAHDGPGVVLALPVPFGDYAVGEFRLDLGGGNGVHTPVPRDALAAIADPPAFLVHDLAVDAPVDGRTLAGTLEVENVGGTDGRFLATFGLDGAAGPSTIAFPVHAGEGIRQSVAVSTAVPTDAARVTVVLDWGVDRLARTVAVSRA